MVIKYLIGLIDCGVYMNKDVKKKIKILYEKYNWSLREIGEKIGLSHETIRCILGPATVRTKKRRNISIDKLEKAYNKTESYQCVADKFNVTRQYVYNRLVYKNKKNEGVYES